jgi:hypothetical protein
METLSRSTKSASTLIQYWLASSARASCLIECTSHAQRIQHPTRIFRVRQAKVPTSFFFCIALGVRLGFVPKSPRAVCVVEELDVRAG